MSDLYERDFYAWANEQASLLRADKLSAADIANIAEEIDSMGRGEKRELASRLTTLLLQLLKWEFQPQRRSRSWTISTDGARDALALHLADNPSLKSKIPEVMETAYRQARRDAAVETGIELATFPVQCPWTFDQAMQAPT